MISMLSGWQGTAEVDGKKYESIEALGSDFKPVSGAFHIILRPKQTKRLDEAISSSQEHMQAERPERVEYKITVKKYMTEKASPGFDFMAKMNGDNPMPLRTMTGWIEKETKGMVYMHLHGVGEPEIHCMRCHRVLTNPVSKKYGIGPECMSKIGFVGIDIEDIDTIKHKLEQLEWTGWVIKSAIVEQEEI